MISLQTWFFLVLILMLWKKCGLSLPRLWEVQRMMKSVALLSILFVVSIHSRLADYLIKNTGARFHNTCTPLFMRRLKEMIIVEVVLCSYSRRKQKQVELIICI